jgi:hypothetical protein
MKTTLYTLSLVIALSFPAQATLYQFGTLNGGSAIGAIPDNSTVGLTQSFTANGEGSSITSLTLTFLLQSGFSSDLSGYLRLGNGNTTYFYDLTSFIHNQTLSQSSSTTYSLDFSTTTFGSDFSSSFGGQNPNDTWTLFFADTSAGGQTTLNGWSLDITAVPEPVNVALGVFAAVFGAVNVRRLIWNPSKKSE